MDKIFASIFGLIFMSVAVGAYFAPTIVAGFRKHHQLGAIAVTNFFGGWTVIGWVIAMAMAASEVKTQRLQQPYNAPQPWVPFLPTGPYTGPHNPFASPHPTPDCAPDPGQDQPRQEERSA